MSDKEVNNNSANENNENVLFLFWNVYRLKRDFDGLKYKKNVNNSIASIEIS